MVNFMLNHPGQKILGGKLPVLALYILGTDLQFLVSFYLGG